MDAALRLTTPLLQAPAGAGGDEWVATEAPVAFQVNGISQAVMLATPQDLDDFALGFALSEGWIARPEQLLGIDPSLTDRGWVLDLQVTAAVEQRLKQRQRARIGRTGCGLCGVEALEQLEALQPPKRRPLESAPSALQWAMDALTEAQALNARCGALHGAGWCAADGSLQIAREDVGRHNALDKVLGAAARRRLDAQHSFIVVSSRASHELVHKTAMAGCGLLASVSAPTSLAIDTALRFGIALWAFVRAGRATRYA